MSCPQEVCSVYAWRVRRSLCSIRPTCMTVEDGRASEKGSMSLTGMVKMPLSKALDLKQVYNCQSSQPSHIPKHQVGRLCLFMRNSKDDECLGSYFWSCSASVCIDGPVHVKVTRALTVFQKKIHVQKAVEEQMLLNYAMYAIKCHINIFSISIGHLVKRP